MLGTAIPEACSGNDGQRPFPKGRCWDKSVCTTAAGKGPDSLGVGCSVLSGIQSPGKREALWGKPSAGKVELGELTPSYLEVFLQEMSSSEQE